MTLCHFGSTNSLIENGRCLPWQHLLYGLLGEPGHASLPLPSTTCYTYHCLPAAYLQSMLWCVKQHGIILLHRALLGLSLLYTFLPAYLCVFSHTHNHLSSLSITMSGRIYGNVSVSGRGRGRRGRLLLLPRGEEGKWEEPASFLPHRGRYKSLFPAYIPRNISTILSTYLGEGKEEGRPLI